MIPRSQVTYRHCSQLALTAGLVLLAVLLPIAAQASHVEVKWRTAVGGDGILYKPREFATPLLSADASTAWLGSVAGVTSLRVSDGKKLWHTHTSEAVVGRPVLVQLPGEASATLIAATMAGTVYAMEPGTGKPRWAQPSRLELPVRSPLAADERFVYVVADPGSLLALDLATGKPSWRWTVTVDRDYLVEGQGGALVFGKTVYVGTPTGKLAALNARDGALLWEVTLEHRDRSQFGDVDTTPVAMRGKDGVPMVLASSHSGGLCAVAPADGAILWRYEVEGLGQPIVTPQGIAVISALGEVHLIGLDGKQLAARKLPSTAAGNLSWYGDMLLVTTESGLDLLRPSDLVTLLHAASEYGTSAAPVAAGPLALMLGNGGVAYGLEIRRDAGVESDLP